MSIEPPSPSAPLIISTAGALTHLLPGDLAFGAPFGMLIACKDSAPVAVSHKAAMAAYGSAEKSKVEIQYFPAVQIGRAHV